MDYCFYLDWKGMTPSEWAAWAQAILSAVAIVVAARLATSQERRARRSKVDAYVEIISHAESEAGSAALHLELAKGKVISTNAEDEWTRLCRVFDNIPFHDVPDFRLYGLLRDAARASANIRDIYEPLLNSDTQIKELDAQLVRTEEHTLRACYVEATEISNELAGLNLKGRIRLAWARLRAVSRRWIGNRKK